MFLLFYNNKKKFVEKNPKCYVQKVPKICSWVISKNTKSVFRWGGGGSPPWTRHQGAAMDPLGSLKRPPRPFALFSAYTSF